MSDSANASPAPAVPLDGPRLQKLLGDFACYLRSAIHYDEPDDPSRVDAAQIEALRAALPGLLADAALLPLMKKSRNAWHAFAEHEAVCAVCADVGFAFCDSGSALRDDTEAADAALSRALPEGQPHG